MAGCRQAKSHYLSQCSPRSVSPNGVTKPYWVNVLPFYFQSTQSSSPISQTSMVTSSLTTSIISPHLTLITMATQPSKGHDSTTDSPVLTVTFILTLSPAQSSWHQGLLHTSVMARCVRPTVYMTVYGRPVVKGVSIMALLWDVRTPQWLSILVMAWWVPW